jgi:WD40 repeat protein
VPPTRSFEAEAELSALALHPGGSEFAAAFKGGKLKVFSSSGKELRACAGAESEALSVAYSGDGRRIVAGCGKSLSIFDAATGERLRSWPGHQQDIEVVAASRDGSLIASGTEDDPVKLWKADGSPIRTLDGGPEVLSIAVSPSGDRVAAGSSDTKVRLFDGKTGALVRATEFPMACQVLVFSSDGRAFAGGSVDGAVSLFDASSGETRGTLGRHAAPAGAAAFSPDGKRLACTSASINPWGAGAELKVWDLTTRRETATSIGVSFLNAVDFTPAGRPNLVSARDRTISVWEL